MGHRSSVPPAKSMRTGTRQRSGSMRSEPQVAQFLLGRTGLGATGEAVHQLAEGLHGGGLQPLLEEALGARGLGGQELGRGGVVLDDAIEGHRGLVVSLLVVVGETEEEEGIRALRTLGVVLQEVVEAFGSQGVVAAVVVQHGGIEGALVFGGLGRRLGFRNRPRPALGHAAQTVVQHPCGVLNLAQALLQIRLEATVLGPGLLGSLLLGLGSLVPVLGLLAQLEDFELEVTHLLLHTTELVLGIATDGEQCDQGRKEQRADVHGASGVPVYPKRKAGAAAPASCVVERLLELELAAAVLAPAVLLGFSAEGLFLAIADGGEAGLVHTQGLQVGQGSGGTAIAEGQVVLVGAPLVAVAFDLDLGGRVGLHEVGNTLQELAIAFLDVGLVEVEMDGLESCFGSLLVGAGLFGFGCQAGGLVSSGLLGGGLAGGFIGSGLVGGDLVSGILVGLGLIPAIVPTLHLVRVFLGFLGAQVGIGLAGLTVLEGLVALIEGSLGLLLDLLRSLGGLASEAAERAHDGSGDEVGSVSHGIVPPG